MAEEAELHFTAVDLRGRTVILDGEGLEHVLEEHREVASVQTIKEAVEKAEVRTKGNFRGSEKLWARNVGPNRWFGVVVAYKRRKGRVITAHGSNKGPPPHRRL
jgi:hypothetical protein